MKRKLLILSAALTYFGMILETNAQIVNNTFFGNNAGTNNTASYCSGFGSFTLFNNTGNSNNAFGNSTLMSSKGGFNCAFGNSALLSNDTGTLNCAFGTGALLNNTTGSANISLGHRSLENNVSGSFNTGIGYFSLSSNIGSANIALGYYTPRHLLSGDSNIFIGTSTANNLLNGSNNVFLGKVTVTSGSTTNTSIGNDANNTIVFADGIGNQRILINKNGNVGIGLGNNVIPANRLDIKGGVVIGKNYTPTITPTSVDGAIAPTNGLLVEGKVGIGTTTPSNKVEITHGTDGNSGLRFTNLTNLNTPAVTATSTQFLGLNDDGDVVLKKIPNSTMSNEIESNQNILTSTVNSILSTTTIVNSISNTINSSNQLITSVNGVATAPIDLPSSNFVEIDASITNELQTLTQNGNVITLSNNGGSFTLPTFTDTDTDDQTLSLNGNNLSIANGNMVTLPTFVEVDGSITNELQTLTQNGNVVTLSNNGGSFTLPTFTDTDTDDQTLSLNGNNLSIANGNMVTLPTFVEVDGSITNELQTLTQNGNVITLSNNGGSFTLPTFTDTDTDDQTLSLNGNNLSIANGNTVTLPTFVEVDGSITNELQTLTQSGNVITLSNNGGSFTLPTFTDTDTDDQTLSLNGNNLSIANGNMVTLPTFVEVDGSITNELQTLTQSGNVITLSNNGGSFTLPTFTDTDTDDQTLSLNGNNLSIANGNTVTLPTFVEVDGSITNELQTLTQSGNVITLSNNGGSFTLPTFTDTDTDDQTLSLNGNNLSIANGNSVTLPTTQLSPGNNVYLTGIGSSNNPYVINSNDTSLYENNGLINPATTVNNNRVVTMNNRNIWFNTATSSSNGRIYIGSTASYPTSTGSYKLFVEGGILTEKVKVALRNTTNWADYVFEKEYQLMPLKEVENFITTNKHLPGIDSAADLAKNGLDLAEMQAKHMAKIEELTLYAIQQNKEIEELKSQVKMLIEKAKSNE